MDVTTVAADIVRHTVLDAREVRSPVIGQEHVLMALGTKPDSLGGRMMAALAVAPATMRTQLMAFVRRGPEGLEPAPTPRLLKALEEAAAEAAECQRPSTSADLVIGILRTHHGVGFQMLHAQGISLERAREALDQVAAAEPDPEMSQTVATTFAEVLASQRG